MKRAKKGFRYIYGPVASWRLGRSLGIDLLSGKEKLCPFDCIYCQLGRTRAYTTKRRLSVPTKEIVQELKRLPRVKIDYLTFSGRGEPTLAKNLGEAIRKVKRLRKEPVAVLTNASLLHKPKVRQELAAADLVAVKLDADAQKVFEIINRPAKGIKFTDILKGMRRFRKEYRGKFALQIMFTQKNKRLAKNIAKLAQGLAPGEVQICTPTRPGVAKALCRRELLAVKRHFSGLRALTPYEVKRKTVKPISVKDTIFRRGKPLK